MIVQKGVLTGCDRNHEWLLPWWWQHYSRTNRYPIAFADFGMSKEGMEWCRKRGELFQIPARSFETKLLSSEVKVSWEKRFGANIWACRTIWLQKPTALLHSPFKRSIWIDLDCEIKGSLKPLFDSLDQADLALARDSVQDPESLFPGEVLYNSGVIVFRQNANILKQWIEAILRAHPMPGDQDYLSRAIYLHQSPFTELPLIYNWSRIWGVNSQSLIHHFCGGSGKLEILKKIGAEAFSDPAAPDFWKRIAKEVSTFLDENAKI